ncbi:MAG: hypothetical protein ACR2I4_08020 [Actinomycetota bacterium]
MSKARVAAVAVSVVLSACTTYQPPPAEPAAPAEVVEEVGTEFGHPPALHLYPAGAWKTERKGAGPGGAAAGTGTRVLRGPIERAWR